MAASANAMTVELPAVFDLDTLDSVRDGLIDAMDRGAVRIDGARVQRVATNALLMLLSAAQTAAHNGRGFEIAGSSEPMLAAIDRLGFKPSFAALMRG